MPCLRVCPRHKGTNTRTIQQYLGHRCIEHAVRYSELAADRFTGIWHD
jgi:site-specific recombinase XerD